MLILNLVLIGLAITLEPIPFTAFALVLASKGGTTKAAFFVAGWILSLGIVVAGLARPEWLVEVDVIAVIPDES